MNTDHEVAVLVADINNLHLAAPLVCPHCNEAVHQALVESHVCDPVVEEQQAALEQLRLSERYPAYDNGNDDEMQR